MEKLVSKFSTFIGFLLLFPKSKPSHRRMLDGWACYILTWLKKVATRLIDPYIVLLFSPSPTFVSINVTLTN